jgi:hypothetical protein
MTPLWTPHGPPTAPLWSPCKRGNLSVAPSVPMSPLCHPLWSEINKPPLSVSACWWRVPGARGGARARVEGARCWKR